MFISFEINEKSEVEIVNSFERIAKDLFNRFEIETLKGNYSFTEIEFYYKTVDNINLHLDSYCHGHDYQLENGTWYFHWSGIDISIGNGVSKGGILIRGVKSNLKYFSGPLNVMKELLSGNVNVKNGNLILKIVPKQKNENKVIYQSKRVGLNPKHDSQFYDKLYRFITDTKNVLHKFKNKTAISEVKLI